MEELKEEVNRAVEVLRKGGIILYPTDTVWGIGCDATNFEAVEKIYALKQSTDKQSMLVLSDTLDRVVMYADNVPQIAWELLEVSDKPLTLILPSAKGVATNLVPEQGTLGIRVADHEFCKKLIHRLGKPIVSTSANISGMPAPTTFSAIDAAIKDGVDMVVDPIFEGSPTGKPSSIIAIDATGAFKIIRP